MSLLLDTHIWIWYLQGSPRLSTKIRAAIERTYPNVWLSPISVWEALLLAERGRIVVQPNPVEWLGVALEQFPLTDAPLNRAVALRSRTLHHTAKDPADRFLLATADVYELRLATADRQLLKSREVATIGP